MEESRRKFVAALTAGVTGALAGCGGSESGTPTEEESPMETETDDSTETGTAGSMETDSSMETETMTQTPEPVAQVVAVGESSFQFTPESFTISAGDTVRWEWDSSGHNVKPNEIPDGSDWVGTPGTDTFSSGHTYSYTFDTPGEYSYYCSPHRASGMRGSFTVTE